MSERGPQIHLFLTKEQDRRLERIARAEGKAKTTIVRTALIGYMNNFDEQVQGREDAQRERRQKEIPTGLNIPAEMFAAPVAPIPSTSTSPDIKSIISYLKAPTPEGVEDERIAQVIAALRSPNPEQALEEITTKDKKITSTLASFFGFGGGKK